ncbi:MAG: NB-ARC domain-containing protein, partial [Acidobacteria bacterium]|nr:NB-ARC domain-containing protein [Acidobacteriota bacterium]
LVEGPPPSTPASHQDWGEAPDVSVFYGRQAEAEQLRQWLVEDKCRLVGVLGMGGIGKTSLGTHLAEQLQAEFDYLIWRSLRNAPPLDEILADWMLFLSDQQIYDLPEELDKRISLLLEQLRQKRCLLVLDNAESILQAGERAGHYRAGYEAYGHLLQRVGESRHQSCLLLTSREKPRELARLEGERTLVRTLPLRNIDPEAGQALLQDRGLSGSEESWPLLLDRYSGNPLALKLVAETIRELFWGDISEFLQDEGLIFGGVWELLSQHFERLSAVEQELLVWLAIEREAVGPEHLQENLVQALPRRELLESLRNLHRRSLLEQTEQGFTLQNVVLEFLTDYLVENVCQEIEAVPGRGAGEQGGRGKNRSPPLPCHLTPSSFCIDQSPSQRV